MMPDLTAEQMEEGVERARRRREFERSFPALAGLQRVGCYPGHGLQALLQEARADGETMDDTVLRVLWAGVTALAVFRDHSNLSGVSQ